MGGLGVLTDERINQKMCIVNLDPKAGMAIEGYFHRYGGYGCLILREGTFGYLWQYTFFGGIQEFMREKIGLGGKIPEFQPIFQ